MIFDDNLVEAIKDGQIVRVSSAQAREEDLFVLNRPGIAKGSAFENSKDTLDLTKKTPDKKDMAKERILNSFFTLSCFYFFINLPFFHNTPDRRLDDVFGRARCANKEYAEDEYK